MRSYSTRRTILTAASSTVALWAVAPWLRSAAAQHPQPMASPNAPANQNVPGGLDPPPMGSSQRLSLNTINAEEIETMVLHLYEMARELKEEADRTNLKNTLPVDFVKRAQQIEKLAKTIKDRAKA